MVVCKYYQAGRCRYGNNCKYEHIDPPGGAPGANDPFSTPARGGGRHPGGAKTADEQPQWPLSAIGQRDNAELGNELEGDLSPEEVRVMAYSMAPRGMSADVTRQEAQLVAAHRAKVDALLRGGMQTNARAAGTNGFEVKDPFAQKPAGPPQLNAGFNGAPNNSGFAAPPSNPGFGGFGGANMNDSAQQQQGNAFGLPSQQIPPQSQPPFGGGQPPNNSFAQNHNSGPAQQSVPIPNAAPVATAAHDPQFTATQFGFANVPEAAPPPKYY